jgi:hypothetical protein
LFRVRSAPSQRQYHAHAARSGRGLAEHRAWIGQQLHENRRVLRAYEEATVEAEGAEGLPEDQRTQVTGKSLEELAAVQDRGRRTAQTVLAMPEIQRRGLHGMTLAAIRRHAACLDARRRQRQINPVGIVRRANPRSGRPGSRRSARFER